MLLFSINTTPALFVQKFAPILHHFQAKPSSFKMCLMPFLSTFQPQTITFCSVLGIAQQWVNKKSFIMTLRMRTFSLAQASFYRCF